MVSTPRFSSRSGRVVVIKAAPVTVPARARRFSTVWFMVLVPFGLDGYNAGVLLCLVFVGHDESADGCAFEVVPCHVAVVPIDSGREAHLAADLADCAPEGGRVDFEAVYPAVVRFAAVGEWWFSSKEYEKAISCMEECAQEHLVDGNELGTANDFYLIGCAYRELKNYEKAISTFLEAREYFKVSQEVIQVARCDQKLAHCYVEIGDAESALKFAQKSVDVFATAHDQRRLTYASFELGKVQVLNGEVDEGLATLERVLDIAADTDPRDFEFIVAIERRIAQVLRTTGRGDEADEIERRISAVTEIIEE